MPRALKPCSTAACLELVPAGGPGRCPGCVAQAEQRRGTAAQRGYGRQWRTIRRTYLRHHPTCQLCGAPSEVPDHHPRSRRELVDAGVPDPDAAQYLRPLCRPCHSMETTRHQPGGWAAAR